MTILSSYVVIRNHLLYSHGFVCLNVVIVVVVVVVEYDDDAVDVDVYGQKPDPSCTIRPPRDTSDYILRHPFNFWHRIRLGSFGTMVYGVSDQVPESVAIRGECSIDTLNTNGWFKYDPTATGLGRPETIFFTGPYVATGFKKGPGNCPVSLTHLYGAPVVLFTIHARDDALASQMFENLMPHRYNKTDESSVEWCPGYDEHGTLLVRMLMFT